MTKPAAVEEFAAFLSEIKSRTDHSYEALGRRLNISASTLHRYCAGDTVPADYATVERLARICGAKPDELVELHRLWIVAAASRDRRTGRAASAQDADPAPAASGRGNRGGRFALDRFLRGRWIAVVGGVAAAVAATATIYSGIGPSRADGSGPPEDPGGGGGPTLAPQPAPTLVRPTAGPRTTPATTPAPTAAAAAKGSPSASRSGSGSVPLTVTTRPVWYSASSCGHTYLLPKPVEEAPDPPESDRESRQWAAKHGAVDGGLSAVEITVQGRSGKAVVLHALRVKLVHRNSPLRQNAYSVLPECGGGIVMRHFQVNLDLAKPVARSKPGNDVEPIPAVRFPYKVSESEPEILDVEAKTVLCDCGWYLELDWSSEGREGTLRIDDRGQPFRTSSIQGRQRYEWNWLDPQPRWVRK